MGSLRQYVFSVILLVSFGHLEAACPPNWITIGSRCFGALSGTSNWENATLMCNKDLEGAHLAYINDCTLMRPIANYLTFLGSEEPKYWIGASDQDTEGTWIWNEDSGSSVAMGVPFWGTSGPGWIEEPNGGGDENCAVLDTDDQCYFHDENCEDEYNVLCEYVPTQETKNEEVSKNTNKIDPQYTSCPEDFEMILTACFHFHFDPDDETTKTSYSEAESICAEKGARLAALPSCNLFQEVVSHITNHEAVQLPEKASYWIGATDSETEGYWTWDGLFTEVPAGCPFWGSRNGNPEPASNDKNQNCGLLYRDNQYRFHDGECYKKAYPLCQLI